MGSLISEILKSKEHFSENSEQVFVYFHTWLYYISVD